MTPWRRHAREAPAILSLAVSLLAARSALAQDGDDTPPLMPQAPNASTGDSIAHHARWFLDFAQTPPGRAVVGLIVVLSLVRVFFALRARARKAAVEGGGGVFGDFFAGKRLEHLVATGQFEAAGEHVLVMAQSAAGPPHDPTREIEAAELFLKARRFVRAAEIFVRKGKPKRAAEAYERAGTFDLAAELFEKAGELDRAEENYLKAKNKAAVARMWAHAGNHAKAAAYYTEITRPKEAAEHLEKLGKKADAVQKYVEAYSLLSTGASRDRAIRPGERDLGVESEGKDLFAKICKLYDELQDWDAYAKFLIKNNRQDAAAEVFRKAGDLEKAAELLRETRSWDAAGRLMKEMGREREALTFFAQARQERGELDKAAELYVQAGELRIAAENYEKLGQSKKAAELYEKLRDTQRAADLYAKTGDYAKAATLYETAKAWNAAVFCWEQQGELEHVGACWEKAGNPFLAGVTYFTARAVPKAIEALRKVPKTSEDRKEAARLLGILLHEAGKERDALPLFEEGFGRKIEKDDVEAFYYYAQTLETLPPERPKAVSAYETIQKLRPGYRDVSRRLEALKAGRVLPKTSIYADGQDDPGSLFHTSRFNLQRSSEKGRPA